MNINQLMKQKWFIPAAVVVGVLVVGALLRGAGERAAERAIERAAGGDADIDVDDGKITVKTDEGEWSTGGEMPKDWPSDVPVYGGAKVLYSASANPATGSAGSYLALQSSDSPDKVADFYKRELVAKGWTITSTATVNGAVYLGAQKAGRQLAFTASPAEGGTSVTLGISAE
jgi:hypothetical protein